MNESNILVLSSHTDPRLTAPVNHAVYTLRHGYGYLFDVTPYPLASKYDQKLWSIVETMKRSRAAWILWIDDDAYFMDHSVRLESFLPADDGVDLIICRSPPSPAGKWSLINTGIFFIRNTADTLAMMVEARDTDFKAVEAWWNVQEHGNVFVQGGDQERLLYVLFRRGLIGARVRLLTHNAFNSRAYDFTECATQQFVCHMASHRDKLVPYNAMRERFGLDKFLLAPNVGEDLRRFSHSMFWTVGAPKHETSSLLRRVRDKAARLLKRASHSGLDQPSVRG